MAPSSAPQQSFGTDAGPDFLAPAVLNPLWVTTRAEADTGNWKQRHKDAEQAHRLPFVAQPRDLQGRDLSRHIGTGQSLTSDTHHTSESEVYSACVTPAYISRQQATSNTASCNQVVQPPKHYNPSCGNTDHLLCLSQQGKICILKHQAVSNYKADWTLSLDIKQVLP